MNCNYRRLLAGVIAVSLLAGRVYAGPLPAGPLPTDPNAIAGLANPATGENISVFSNTTGGVTLLANVEYAVYAPGQFGTSAALGLPAAADPSHGTQYVYAYEIFNQNVPGHALVSTMTVALTPTGNPANITHVSANVVGGMSPFASQFIPAGTPKTSAKWTWLSNLTPGTHSDILLFTSPNPPRLVTSSMLGGSNTLDAELLPSPVPEPGSLALSLAALGTLIAVRALRRKS